MSRGDASAIGLIALRRQLDRTRPRWTRAGEPGWRLRRQLAGTDHLLRGVRSTTFLARLEHEAGAAPAGPSALGERDDRARCCEISRTAEVKKTPKKRRNFHSEQHLLE